MKSGHEAYGQLILRSGDIAIGDIVIMHGRSEMW